MGGRELSRAGKLIQAPGLCCLPYRDFEVVILAVRTAGVDVIAGLNLPIFRGKREMDAL